MTAARKQPTRTTAMLRSTLWRRSRPAVKSSESPGRKKPISRPDSAKMMRISPIVPNVSQQLLRVDDVGDARQDHRDRLDGAFCRSGPGRFDTAPEPRVTTEIRVRRYGRPVVQPKSSPVPKSLVIVESKTKADTIGRFLGRDYTVMASVGHVRDLPRKGLAIDVEEPLPARVRDLAREDEGRRQPAPGAQGCRRALPRDR